MTLGFRIQDYDSVFLGIDETNLRLAGVWLKICRSCETIWLYYEVNYRPLPNTERWFRGIIDLDMIIGLWPHNAVERLEGLPWYFYGGEFFNSEGQKGSGMLLVDSAFSRCSDEDLKLFSPSS